MSHTLTIVMYHYVRDLAHSRYPAIKALKTQQFRAQIAHIQHHYHVISAADLLDCLASGAELPPSSLLLTFDDGYIDHFTEVFPILDAARLPACFFIPARSVLEERVLDVNKIHFVLAAAPNPRALVQALFELLDRYRDAHELPTNEALWQQHARPGRLDPAEVMFVKRLLQRELPEGLRARIVDELFARFVSRDEASFSHEIYMDLDQIRCLARNGMTIGGHGYSHDWLNTLDRRAQTEEIRQTRAFLAIVGQPLGPWIMCYPYGAYNESLLELLAENECLAGLTTEVGQADLAHDHPLRLPRLDTNYLAPRSLPLPAQRATRAPSPPATRKVPG